MSESLSLVSQDDNLYRLGMRNFLSWFWNSDLSAEASLPLTLLIMRLVWLLIMWLSNKQKPRSLTVSLCGGAHFPAGWPISGSIVSPDCEVIECVAFQSCQHDE